MNSIINNPVTRWIAGAVAAVALLFLTWAAGRHQGRKAAEAETKLRTLKRRLEIYDAQDKQAGEAETIRQRDRGPDDAGGVPDYHVRDDRPD